MAPTHKRSRIAGWYDKVAAFKVEDLFSRKKEPGPQRTIFVNENLPDDYHDARGKVLPDHVYATNQVITSKYTIVTFLPRNLLEQFRRIANMYVYTLYHPSIVRASVMEHRHGCVFPAHRSAHVY